MEVYLKKSAYDRILSGSKTIEFRKYTGIFKEIKINDVLYFVNNQNKILVKIKNILISDLNTLISKINIKKTGFDKIDDYIKTLHKCYNDLDNSMVAIEFKLI